MSAIKSIVNCPVKNLEPGTLFGHNGWRGINRPAHYMTSARCVTQTATIMQITFKEFDNLCRREHFIEFIREHIKADKLMTASNLATKVSKIIKLRKPAETIAGPIKDEILKEFEDIGLYNRRLMIIGRTLASN
jgi:3-keto-L-gulonate-6-phosphate decarboxylase